MPKKSKTPQFSDTELTTIARHFERAFTAPFTQRYSDAPTFRQRYSDAPMAALLVNWRNAKSRRRRKSKSKEEDHDRQNG